MEPGPGPSQGLAKFPPEPGEWDQEKANEELLEIFRQVGNIEGDQIPFFRDRLDVLSVDHDKNFVNQVIIF